MNNILVTGATGNIGKEVIKSLISSHFEKNIIAGVRNVSRAKDSLSNSDGLEFRTFDFESPSTFKESLKNIDIIFLLRPPHISDIETIFTPLFEEMKSANVNKVVFLSVQGAEKSKIIPHNKIENLLNKYNFESVMLRPSYFMQNLTTTLYNDLKKKKIVLPSGNAKFNWIDIKDIGEVTATIISQFDAHRGEAIELTGLENLSYPNVIASINKILNANIKYKSVNPLKYYFIKKNEGYEKGQIIVMLLLHLIPRFQKEPNINTNIEKIIGRPPRSIIDFLHDNNNIITK